jgi:peroxiredoxin
MTIQIGDRIPEVNIKRINESIETVDTPTFFEGKKIVLFSVPGAFTPTCSEKHLPGYVALFDAFRDKGIGVACMSVNDPFVMKAWAASQNAPTATGISPRPWAWKWTPAPTAWASAASVSRCSSTMAW